MGLPRWDLPELDRIILSALCAASSGNLEDLFDTESKMDGGTSRKPRILTKETKDALTRLHNLGLIVVPDSFFFEGICGDLSKVTPYHVTADGFNVNEEL